MAVDFCHPDEPLDAYQAVVVPSLYLMTERQGANLVSYVEAGGTAVVSFWSGVVDEPRLGLPRSLWRGGVDLQWAAMFWM